MHRDALLNTRLWPAMSNNNDSGKFFKFKNLQLVHKQNPARQTRQNTDLRTPGTAEEQFAAITAAARAEALREIDNLLSDRRKC